jgi:hypothetical protein
MATTSRPTLPNVPVHNGKKFTWRSMKAATEASDLGRPVHGQLWDDACDVGFYIESHRTGTKALFALASQERSDGDVVSTTYRSVDLPMEFEVVVFND